ncbi:hypothetical protein DFR67_101379 [Williamsia limnetica]|uniref:Uncharacterized protein n=1 Tax=Williamsia limnetica TaxID=882452 RepID=A0A318RQ24_WILLI|nr:hypothetical protein DFR67_101379 [Williamsia limnetica]
MSGVPTHDVTPAQQVATAVTGLDGVAELHGGVLGEVATYLPGGRVNGVRLDRSGVEVHVVLFLDDDIRAVAAEVQRVASDVVGVPATVVVEDVVARV